MKKQMVCCLLICGILLMTTGCMGRTAYPVQVSQLGDQNKSCDALSSEIAMIHSQIQQKSGAVDKAATNDIIAGGVGLLLFWPALFMMDLDNADQTELEALINRHNHLQRLYSQCGQ